MKKTLKEEEFMKQVMELAKKTGWRRCHFRPAMAASGRWLTAGQGDWKGFPDLIMVRGKKLIFVELKTNEGELSDKQIDWMADLFLAGADCRLWSPMCWEEITETLSGGCDVSGMA